MIVWKLIRGNEWWHYKLPVFLTMTYVFLFSHTDNIFPYLFALLKVLFSICLGGAFVGVLNEYFDLVVDYVAGKIKKPTNKLKQKMMLGLILSFVLLVLYGSYLYASSWVLLFVFSVSILSFSLYSIPPFRFKDKGILGVLCDAIGAVVGPQLLIVLSLSHWFQIKIEPFWFVCLVIWSFCVGSRGILWHQFQDKKNDLISNVNTFAVNFPSDKMRFIEYFLVGFEVFSLFYLCSGLSIWIQIIAPLLYFSLVIYNRLVDNEEVVLITSEVGQRTQFLLLDYYLLILSLVLFFCFSFVDKSYFVLLVLQFVLFPKELLRYCYKFYNVLIRLKIKFFNYGNP